MLPQMREKQSGPASLGPKQFKGWYALDYFQRARGLWGRPFVLVGLPVVLCVGWLVVEHALGNWRIYESGPVSSVSSGVTKNTHDSFENDCRKCHTTPLRPAVRFLPWEANTTTVSDEACIACHHQTPHANIPAPAELSLRLGPLQGAPAPLHGTSAAVVACARCHREHRPKASSRGKHSLTHVATGHCVDCHGDLKRMDGAVPTIAVKVTSFARDEHDAKGTHPEINWPKDTGTVRFNHDLHTQQGVLRRNGEREKLACASCHKSSPSDDSEENGRYMKPVKYDLHCARCHPLSVAIFAEGMDEPTRRAAALFAKQPAPHKEPTVIRSELQKRYLTFEKSHPNVLKSIWPGEREHPLPLGNQGRAVQGRSAPWQKVQMAEAERGLFSGGGGCRYCHQPEGPWRPDELPKFVPSAVPPRWLTHSLFSHAKHSDTECRKCHEVANHQKTSDVMMPKLETCQSCHNKPGMEPGKASSDCVQCHRYHDWRKEHGLRSKSARHP
jgi:hypothetical protein